MKHYKSIGKLLAAVGFAALTFTSCTEDVMDKINENPNNAHTVPAKFVLSDVGVSTAFGSVGGDCNLYAAVYMEHEVGTGQQLWRAEHRSGEPAASSTYNNSWLTIYSNIKNARLVIDKCQNEDSDKGNVVTEAIAHILLAYNGALVTDLFGDTPYSQAGVVNEDGTPMYKQPKIDTQESIYQDVMKHLDTAIELLDNGKAKDAGPSGAIGAKDYIYNGDAAKWLKAAYALKARYTLHLLNKSADPTADLNNILAYAKQSFTSADEECKLNIYDGNSQLNPLFAYNYSRGGSLGASQSLVNKFIQRNDPRGDQSFVTVAKESGKSVERQVQDMSKIKAAPNGTALESASMYDYSMIGFGITTPTQLISYHELLFIEAEALARLGKPEAENKLKEAVCAAFANTEKALKDANTNWIKDDVAVINLVGLAENYFDTEVKAVFAANPVKEVMLQKYLAFFGASGESVEAYNDYRRLKAEGKGYEVTLENPENAKYFPHRFGYGGSDVTANQEIKAVFGDGSYVYAEPVWWAGGKC